MMKEKDYQKPTMEVVKLCQQCGILAGSNPASDNASIDDYEENTLTW